MANAYVQLCELISHSLNGESSLKIIHASQLKLKFSI